MAFRLWPKIFTAKQRRPTTAGLMPSKLRRHYQIGTRTIHLTLHPGEVRVPSPGTEALPRIIKGLHVSLASRVVSLAKRAGIEPDVCITGGVAKNRGVIDAVAKKLDDKIVTFPAEMDPQLIGALGAALIAADHAKKQKEG